MRITVEVDDELIQSAAELTGVTEPKTLVREGLKALVEQESARRLALLGGSEPGIEHDLAEDIASGAVLTWETDPVLAELWDNPKDAEYDRL
jgi:Arc/MetJ family transcription regulator